MCELLGYEASEWAGRTRAATEKELYHQPGLCHATGHGQHIVQKGGLLGNVSRLAQACGRSDQTGDLFPGRLRCPGKTTRADVRSALLVLYAIAAEIAKNQRKSVRCDSYHDQVAEEEVPLSGITYCQRESRI